MSNYFEEFEKREYYGKQDLVSQLQEITNHCSMQVGEPEDMFDAVDLGLALGFGEELSQEDNNFNTNEELLDEIEEAYSFKDNREIPEEYRTSVIKRRNKKKFEDYVRTILKR